MNRTKTSAPVIAAAKLAAQSEGGGGGTPTGAESDFDWDETDSSDEEEAEAVKRAKEEVEADRHRLNVKRAKRLRKVYIACMRLSRPVRTALIGLMGGGILVVPAIVIWTAYNNDRTSSVVRDNVRVWSLWLMILWTCECLQAITGENIVLTSCVQLPAGRYVQFPEGSAATLILLFTEHLCRCYSLHGLQNLCPSYRTLPCCLESSRHP